MSGVCSGTVVGIQVVGLGEGRTEVAAVQATNAHTLRVDLSSTTDTPSRTAVARQYTFDHIIAEVETDPERNRTDTELESLSSGIAAHCLSGHPTLVFSYGCEEASRWQVAVGPRDSAGVTRRGAVGAALDRVFEASPRHPVKVSCFQLRSESFHDLLYAPLAVGERGGSREREEKSDAVLPPLRMRESTQLGVFLEGLRTETVTCTGDALALVARALDTRSVDPETGSFDSHVFIKFQLHPVQRRNGRRGDVGGEIQVINLLHSSTATSPHPQPSLHRHHEHHQQGARSRSSPQWRVSSVSKSLGTLHRVVDALATRKRHVPFRDSALTRILKNGLRGDTKKVLFATVHADPERLGETLATLHFACCMKKLSSAVVAQRQGLTSRQPTTPVNVSDCTQAPIAPQSTSDQGASPAAIVGDSSDTRAFLEDSDGLLRDLRALSSDLALSFQSWDLDALLSGAMDNGVDDAADGHATVNDTKSHGARILATHHPSGDVGGKTPALAARTGPEVGPRVRLVRSRGAQYVQEEEEPSKLPPLSPVVAVSECRESGGVQNPRRPSVASTTRAHLGQQGAGLLKSFQLQSHADGGVHGGEGEAHQPPHSGQCALGKGAVNPHIPEIRALSAAKAKPSPARRGIRTESLSTVAVTATPPSQHAPAGRKLHNLMRSAQQTKGLAPPPPGKRTPVATTAAIASTTRHGVTGRGRENVTSGERKGEDEDARCDCAAALATATAPGDSPAAPTVGPRSVFRELLRRLAEAKADGPEPETKEGELPPFECAQTPTPLLRALSTHQPTTTSSHDAAGALDRKTVTKSTAAAATAATTTSTKTTTTCNERRGTRQADNPGRATSNTDASPTIEADACGPERNESNDKQQARIPSLNLKQLMADLEGEKGQVIEHSGSVEWSLSPRGSHAEHQPTLTPRSSRALDPVAAALAHIGLRNSDSGASPGPGVSMPEAPTSSAFPSSSTSSSSTTAKEDGIAGGDPLQLIDALNSENVTLLNAKFLRAVQNGNEAMAKRLFASGVVNIDAQNTYGRSAVHIASRNGHLELVRWLHTEGADFHHAGKGQDNAFHLAAWNGHVEVLKFLFHEAKLDAWQRGARGQTAVHVAARRGEVEVLRWLHFIGLGLWDKDEDGLTPVDHTRMTTQVPFVQAERTREFLFKHKCGTKESGSRSAYGGGVVGAHGVKR